MARMLVNIELISLNDTGPGAIHGAVAGLIFKKLANLCARAKGLCNNYDKNDPTSKLKRYAIN